MTLIVTFGAAVPKVIFNFGVFQPNQESETSNPIRIFSEFQIFGPFDKKIMFGLTNFDFPRISLPDFPIFARQPAQF